MASTFLPNVRARSTAVMSAPNDCGLPSIPTRIVSRSASPCSGTCLTTQTSRSDCRATRSHTEPITLSRARPIPRAPITTRSCCELGRTRRRASGAKGGTCAHVARPSAVTPPDQTDHDQLDDKKEERDPDHRAHNRRYRFGPEVNRVPHRQTSPVAPLAGEPVPDREGNGHE